MRKKYDREINELKRFATFTGDNLSDLKKDMEKSFKSQEFEKRDFLRWVKERFAGHEDRDRRNNLRSENIPEQDDSETWDESEEKVKKEIEKFGISLDSIHIERAHRVEGKRISG